MPVTLPSRRTFLAASAGVLVVRPARAADADPHRVALLSDTHVAEKEAEVSRECNMADRLKQVAAELTKLDPKPVAAVVNGDLAFNRGGNAGQYTTFAKLIEPVREAGIPLHLGLGNHDNFDRFAAGMEKFRPKERPVEGKQVLVVDLERANLVVLDSFDPKNAVGGKLGEEQLKWLALALDARKTKPALVFAHHPLQTDGKGTGGVADTAALWPILKDRPWVKAYVFGHTHTWKLAEKDGVHLVNLPAVGYPFAKGEVSGWVDAHLSATGVKLVARAIDPKHANHGKTAELKWRAG